jgi:hypothetical protein
MQLASNGGVTESVGSQKNDTCPHGQGLRRLRNLLKKVPFCDGVFIPFV